MAINYAQLKADMIEDSLVTTIHGVPIEYEGGEGRAGGELTISLGEGGLFPIWGHCLCVQDDPTGNPCRCHGPILWLHRGKIFKHGRTGKKDAEGNEIYWFKLDPNTQIVIDAQIPSTAKLYAQALKKFGEEGITTVFSVPSPWPHPITLAFYAFMALNALGAFEEGSWEDWICPRFPDHPICKK